MPYPRQGEAKDAYIARFMDSAEAKKDFPDEKQRVAVAYSMYEKKNSSLYSGNQEMPWPKSYKCNFIEPGVVHYQDLGPCKVCGDQRVCGNQGDECQVEGETILVGQDTLDRMAATFVGKPVIDKEHKEVTPSTIIDGEADGVVTRVWKENGWSWCDFLVWNPETQKHCDEGLFSVSCAYEPTQVDDTGGEYHNIPYASEIKDGCYTHLAIVQSPRYEGARILVNSKGGRMSWKFWEKGSRKNALPLDPEKEMVDVGGKKVSLKNLYDALPDEEKPKYNDDTVLSTPKGEKTLGELKKNYLDKEEKKNAEGEAIKTSAPADTGHGSHEESPKGGFQHNGACDHCRHPAFNEKDGEQDSAATPKPLPDLRDRRQNDQVEEAAKKLDAETKEKAALELEQKKNAADEEAKKEEERKNAEDAEKKSAEEKKEKEELANAKKLEGRKSFESLRNARSEYVGDTSKILPATVDERLAKGKSKYGSPA